MTVIKEVRGRVAAGKRMTRPVSVHMRTVPILTERGRERAEAAATVAVFAALIALVGALEASTWPL